MTDIKHLKPTKLLWMDLEMTGVDPSTQVIVEVAAKVTDFDFRELANYHALIAHPQTAFEAANEWTRTQFGGPGGLFERAQLDGKPESVVVDELTDLIHDQFASEPAVLAGNSIHQDRRFIRQWWPEVEALLHYRMFDVSSFKVWILGKYGLEFEKKETHRALDDIDESIAELQYYLKWFKTSGKADS